MKNRPFCVLFLAFFLSGSLGPWPAQAQVISLPVPGTMLSLSRAYMPVSVKGLMLNPKEPFKFDFLIDSGDTGLKGDALKPESMKLIKYFLAALTVPDNEMWVNLSPYEKDRIIPKSFGDTEMGRDLLAQDYILKQLTASLTYPEKDMGKQFWNKVYSQAQAKFGTSNIPVNTFNKVWIVPSTAKIYEHNNGAFVVESRLKVMLEEDYLAVEKNRSQPGDTFRGTCPQAGCQANEALNVKANIIREIIIPALEQEVNEGAHFANLRQIYQAMILATWYKIRLKDSILSKLYVNKDKTKGVALNDPQANQKIYQQYLAAFKKGVYNYIKEDQGPTGQTIPRKYVSGGFDSAQLSAIVVKGLSAKVVDAAQLGARGDMSMVAFQVVDKPSVTLRSGPSGVQIMNNKVRRLSFGPGYQIRQAVFSYDPWGQIRKVVLVKGEYNGRPSDAKVYLHGRTFNFSYRDSVPNISLHQKGRVPWIFSGYKLVEQEADGSSKGFYVTIKSFGDIPALESDGHDAMYYFLKRFSKKAQKTALINFDLHSDNYDVGGVRPANWVRRAKKQGLVDQVTWVYPPWHDIEVTEIRKDGRAKDIIDHEVQDFDGKDGRKPAVVIDLQKHFIPPGFMSAANEKIIRASIGRFQRYAEKGKDFLRSFSRGALEPRQKVMVTFDFDYISSKGRPHRRIAGRDEIDKAVARAMRFISRNKASLSGINFNRSAFDENGVNYAPQNSSNYILNVFVSRANMLLGEVHLTRIKGPSGPGSLVRQVHPDAAMAAKPANAPQAMVEKGQVMLLTFGPQYEIQEASFAYDQWGQLDSVLLTRSESGTLASGAKVPLKGGQRFIFSYKDGMPDVYIERKQGPWIFSGYDLLEHDKDRNLIRSHVTVQSFGGRYPALGSHEHDAMYYWLKLIQTRQANKGRDLDLVNFDLHHDNYHYEKEMGPDNWVRAAKQQGLFRKAIWVYPPWYMPSEDARLNASLYGIIDQQIQDPDAIKLDGKAVVTVDFDYISSAVQPQKHIADRGEIDHAVERIMDFVAKNKTSLAGINFTRSSYSSTWVDWSPRDASNYILNALVSKANMVLGKVRQVKIRDWRDTPLLAQKVHGPDAAMTAENTVELGTAAITGDMVRMFAFEGDRNPLHTDEAEAKRSLFKGLVSHGVLTMEMALSEITRQYPQYSITEVQDAAFFKPVYFGNKIHMTAKVSDSDGGGKALDVTIDSEDRKRPPVATLKLSLSPVQDKNDLPEVTPQERENLARLAQEVTTRKPKVIYDFTQAGSPRKGTITQVISKENIQSLQVLFGSTEHSLNDREFISQSIARKMMTRALAEIIPGHAIGALRNIRSGVLAQEGDTLTAHVSIGQVTEVYKDGPKHRVNAVVDIVNQKGEMVLRSDVLMVMIMDNTVALPKREIDLLERLMNRGGLLLDRRMSFMRAVDALIEVKQEQGKGQDVSVSLETTAGIALRRDATMHDKARPGYINLSRVGAEQRFVRTVMAAGPKYGLIEAMEALEAVKKGLKPPPSMDEPTYWELLRPALDQIEWEDRVAGGLRIIELMRSSEADEMQMHLYIKKILSRLRSWGNEELDRTLDVLVVRLKQEDAVPQLQPLSSITEVLEQSRTPAEAIAGLKSLVPGSFVKDAAMTASNGPYWLNGVNSGDLAKVQQTIFGKGTIEWLEKYGRRMGNQVLMKAAVKQMAEDPAFMWRLRRAGAEAGVEVIRYAVQNDLYLGTRSFQVFFRAFNEGLAKRHEGPAPMIYTPVRAYIALMTALGHKDVQKYLQSGKFGTLPREDRLAGLVGTLNGINVPLGIDNFGQIYIALPQVLAPGVNKEDIQQVNISMEAYRKLREAFGDTKVRRYLQSDAFIKTPEKDRLEIFLAKLKEWGLVDQGQDNLFGIYTAFPKGQKGLFKSPISSDAAMTATLDRPHYVDTIYRVSQPGKKEQPTLYIWEIFDLPLTPEEQEHVIRQIKQDPRKEVVLLKSSTIKKAKERRTELTPGMGIIPQGFWGKEAVFGGNTTRSISSLWSHSLKELPRTGDVIIRAAGYFRIKVHDKEHGTDLYLLLFNHGELVKGKRRLGAVGGSYQLTPDGKSLYEQRGIQMTMLKKDPLEMRFMVPGAQVDGFLELFHRGVGRETTPLRELKEELIGPDSEAKLFDQVPESWRAHDTDVAMTAKTPGGIDLNAKGLDLQIKRDANGAPLPAGLQNLEGVSIDGLYPVLLGIVPIHNLNSLLFG